jgi:uncharacterized protein YbjT (DUF2867 family)
MATRPLESQKAKQRKSASMTTNTKIITVFGGTGFLGRHIIWALAKTGATIRVATRLRQRAYFLRPAGFVGQIVPLSCDPQDDASVAAALQGATHVVNLIGILKEKRRSSFERIHVEIAERIAKACRAADVDLLVHVSALGAALDAPSKYARTKAEGENKVIHGFARSAVLRPSLVFGPEDKFFNRFARLARLTEWLPFLGSSLPVVGGGQTRFQPVYVGDIARAVHNIVADPQPEKYHGQIYELGGAKVYSFRELLETLLRCTHQQAKLRNIPFPVAGLLAALPGVPLTFDELRNLKRDSVIQPGSPGLKELGVEASGIEAVLPAYLAHYRPGGRFGEKSESLAST